MNVEDYDPTVPFYAIANEDYQDTFPAGTIVVVIEIRDPYINPDHLNPDHPMNRVWQLTLPGPFPGPGRYRAIVPSGSQAELFLRTGKVARPGTQG